MNNNKGKSRNTWKRSFDLTYDQVERKKFRKSELAFGVKPENLYKEPESIVDLFLLTKHAAKSAQEDKEENVQSSLLKCEDAGFHDESKES